MLVFCIILLCNRKRTEDGNPYVYLVRSFLNSDKVILLADRRFAEALEAVKSHAALSASTPELISILADVVLEIRL
jgi:hypothetical protein